MIPVIELIRLEESAECGTFGVLRINKRVFCVTLEPPDRENERDRSSIPPQQYICRRFQSEKFGETFAVTEVPGRSGILFHSGNRAEHTSGCILLAEHFGQLDNTRGISSSGRTFTTFMERLRGHDAFHLTIFEHF